jgi:hypothetical protein
MTTARKNRLRDESILWFIVDALKSEAAIRRLTRSEQRDFIKHRLAQERRVDVSEIASGRNRTLYCALTRIYYLANPRSEAAAAELAQARGRGFHFLTCYAIAIGRKTLSQIDQSKSN